MITVRAVRIRFDAWKGKNKYKQNKKTMIFTMNASLFYLRVLLLSVWQAEGLLLLTGSWRRVEFILKKKKGVFLTYSCSIVREC